MFKSKQTSAFPWGWGKAPKKAHKKRNALIIGAASAAMLGIAGLLGKKVDES